MIQLSRTSLLIFSAIILLSLSSRTGYGQAAQYLHSAGIVLDDGAGHTSTLLPTTSLTGVTPAYLNAYTTFVPFTIPPGGTIPISTVATNSGFVDLGFGIYRVTITGVYNVEYTVSRNEPSAIALSVNGATALNSQFGCATGTTVVHGSAMLQLTAGDVLKLIASPSNFLSITLSSVVPGVVQASMTVIRIQ